MSLQDEIQNLQEKFLKDVPRETVDIIFQATADLDASGIADKALKEGDSAPEFILPDAAGVEISSSELLSKGPLVLNFYRGGWCPYCNLELKAYQDRLLDIQDCGAQLVAISPNLPEKSLFSIEKHMLEYAVLSDLQNTVAKSFDLVFTLDDRLRPLYEQFGINISEYNGDQSFELPMPATYVVDKSGVIRLAFIDADYSRRLAPEKVIEMLRTLE